MKPLRATSGALTFAAALATTLVTTLAVPTAAHAATVTFTRTSQWPGGYVASFTVHNDTDSPLNGWQVAFDLPAQTQITNHWYATLSRDGERYVFTDAGWNARVAPGASVTFGWLAAGDDDPVRCTVNGDPCGEQVLPDLRSPSAPGNVRNAPSEGITLTWDPSTDDTGVVGYQVYESGGLIREVTDTTAVIYGPGPIPPKIFVFAVRAVDAAGNVGPFTYVPMEWAWTGQSPPPAPTGLRVVAEEESGIVSLAWDRTPWLPFSNAPIAGYEVYVDGVLADRVGGNAARVRVGGPGTHQLTVRAFDAYDRYSAPVHVRSR